MFYRAEKSGEKADQLLPSIITTALKQLPVGKMMRWGDHDYQFVRPVKWVLMLLGDQVIDAEFYGQKTSNVTYGHRVMSPEGIAIESPKKYQSALYNKKVIANFKTRQKEITPKITDVFLDQRLINEVTALTEWPVVLEGEFDEKFLELPPQLINIAIKSHQKSFLVKKSINKNSSNITKYEATSRFRFFADIESQNTSAVIHGNEKVVNARLNDALFFYQQDKQKSLHDYLPKLDKMLFHQKLGSLTDKTKRIVAVSEWVATQIGADIEKAKRVAQLCKASLATSVIFEFPELQDIMGFYYALPKEDAEIANAICEHYYPKDEQSDVPGCMGTPKELASSVAIADRIDTLVGLFGVNEKPTGSKDPLALRRAMFSIVRICIENQLSLSISDLIDQALEQFEVKTLINKNTKADLLNFLSDRIESYYIKQDYHVHSIRAIIHSNGDNSNLYHFNQRLTALQALQENDSIQTLAQINKRVKNLIRKNPIDHPKVIATQLQEPAEKTLYSMLLTIKEQVSSSLQKNNYANALEQLTQLATPLAQFFDQVMVLTEDQALRHNRLSILYETQQLLLKIADFSYLNE